MVLCRTPALDGCAVDLFKFHPGKTSAHFEGTCNTDFYYIFSLHVASAGITKDNSVKSVLKEHLHELLAAVIVPAVHTGCEKIPSSCDSNVHYACI